MKKFKSILSLILLTLLVGGFTLGGSLIPNKTFAESSNLTPYHNTYTYSAPTRGYDVTLEFTSVVGLEGDVVVSFQEEANEETLKKFEKYCKKKLDAGDIGEVFYVSYSLTNEEADKKNFNGQLKYTVKLPKFYKNKEILIFCFTKLSGFLKISLNQIAIFSSSIYNCIYCY